MALVPKLDKYNKLPMTRNDYGVIFAPFFDFLVTQLDKCNKLRLKGQKKGIELRIFYPSSYYWIESINCWTHSGTSLIGFSPYTMSCFTLWLSLIMNSSVTNSLICRSVLFFSMLTAMK